MNLKDIAQDEPELILVKGVGKVRLDQAIKRVQEMMNDLSERVNNLAFQAGPNAAGWQTVKTLMDRQVLQAYIDAVVEATKQYQ